jgi:hypothetical protein
MVWTTLLMSSCSCIDRVPNEPNLDFVTDCGVFILLGGACEATAS